MENHYTLGIAGHIDHGKTSLTKRLTNVDTDRLKEEQERGVSIELGFAPLQLPGGEQVSVVDVPGHERFIRQMIAGAAGIDLVLLVIAADEGVMPQTREHFDIIRFLGIERGIIVLTKKDLVDEDWLEMVTEEVREWVDGSFLENAPIIAVSSHTGEGIPELLEAVESEIETIPQRDIAEPFRMPIDRVFTKKGAGAVVTGTIYEGSISEGDIVEVFPLGEKVKIRQINVHYSPVSAAFAGQRAALNLSGIDFKEMERGYALTAPDYFRKTDRLDIKFQMLPHHDFPLKQRTRVRLHISTAEIMGKIIFYDRNEIEPGEEVLCQLQLEDEIIAKPGDPFILRRLSPTMTLGGGQVLSPYGVKRKFGEKTVELLKLLQDGDEWQMLQYVLADEGYEEIANIDFQLALGRDRLERLIAEYQDKKEIIRFGEYVILPETLKEWTDKVKTTLMKYHKDYSMRMGMKKSELRSKLFSHMPDKLWREYIIWLRTTNVIEEIDETVKLRNHEPQIPSAIKPSIEKIVQTLRKEGLTVTEWNTLAQKSGLKPADSSEAKSFFMEQGEFVAMSPELLVDAQVYRDTVEQLKKQLPEGVAFTTPQVKDILNISRKYLIPFLESLDEQGLTKRMENERQWIKANS